MQTENLIWSSEKRQIKNLIPTEHNPRKLSAQGRERLAEKINKLGLFESPTVDFDGKLLNFNQRFKILMAMGRGEEWIDVRIPNRPLTKQEQQAIILSSNTHEGEWDQIVLEEYYQEVDLDFIGLDLDFQKQADELLQESEKNNQEPVYPIVREYSEQYHAIVIVCTDEINFNNIAANLGLDKQRCYKTQRVKETKVITDHQFLEVWNKK